MPGAWGRCRWYPHGTAAISAAWPPEPPSYPLTVDVPEIQRVTDAMYEFGLIRAPFDITDMIEPEDGEVR